VRRIFSLLFLLVTGDAYAQHSRLYAVVAGNDDPANFMAGSSLGSGLWQSDDTGKTWKQLGWKHIKAFSMDHDLYGRVLYLAAGNGVLKSTDFGESWKVMTDWSVAEVLDLKVIPRMPNIVIATTAHGVIKSTDSGSTWEPFHRGIEQPYSSRLLLSNNSVFVCTESGLYESDSLTTWRKIEGVPGAIRNISWRKNHLIATGDSSMSTLTFYGKATASQVHEYALWDAEYVHETAQNYVAGIKGVGLVKPRTDREDTETITYEGPRNVHSLVSIGDKLFAGTLGDGIWMKQGTMGEWQAIALPKSQVWTLVAAQIYSNE
jgi:hypothetical protein